MVKTHSFAVTGPGSGMDAGEVARLYYLEDVSAELPLLPDETTIT